VDNAKYVAGEQGIGSGRGQPLREAGLANDGPRMKRIRPAPMGRAFRYQRRLTHIILSVANARQLEGLVTKVEEPAVGPKAGKAKVEELKAAPKATKAKAEEPKAAPKATRRRPRSRRQRPRQPRRRPAPRPRGFEGNSMGQKVHPYGFRLGVNKPWRSRWFSERDYDKLLIEDVKLKAELREKLKAAGVSSVEIERPGTSCAFLSAPPGRAS